MDLLVFGWNLWFLTRKNSSSGRLGSWVSQIANLQLEPMVSGPCAGDLRSTKTKLGSGGFGWRWSGFKQFFRSGRVMDSPSHYMCGSSKFVENVSLSLVVGKTKRQKENKLKFHFLPRYWYEYVHVEMKKERIEVGTLYYIRNWYSMLRICLFVWIIRTFEAPEDTHKHTRFLHNFVICETLFGTALEAFLLI